MITLVKNELVLEISSTMGIAFFKCWGCLGGLEGVIVVPICNYKPIGPYEKIRRDILYEPDSALTFAFSGGKEICCYLVSMIFMSSVRSDLI